MKNDNVQEGLELEKILKLPKGDNLEIRTIFPTKKEITLKDGRTQFVGEWTCDPKYKNNLAWSANNPVTAVEIQYCYPENEINWSAGVNWPIYKVPCPNGSGGMHQILWQFGGITTAICTMSGGARGNLLTEVFVFVRDDKYDDNTGYFKVQIISYKQD